MDGGLFVLVLACETLHSPFPCWWTHHLSSHTLLTFLDFTDELWEHGTCSRYRRLLCYHGALFVKFRTRLVKPCVVGTRLKSAVQELKPSGCLFQKSSFVNSLSQIIPITKLRSTQFFLQKSTPKKYRSIEVKNNNRNTMRCTGYTETSPKIYFGAL